MFKLGICIVEDISETHQVGSYSEKQSKMLPQAAFGRILMPQRFASQLIGGLLVPLVFPEYPPAQDTSFHQ